MGAIAVTYTFANGSNSDATQVNQNFTDLTGGLSDGTKALTVGSVYVTTALSCADQFTMGTTKLVATASNGNLTLAGKLSVVGTASVSGPLALAAYYEPATAVTTVLTANTRVHIVAGAAADTTVVLQTAPTDGQVLVWSTKNDSGRNIYLQVNDGTSIIANQSGAVSQLAFSTMSVYNNGVMVYDSNNSLWWEWARN